VKISARERQLLRIIGVLLAVFLGLQVFAILWEALGRVADVLIIFGAAWAFSYVLSPLVDRIDRRTRLNRFGAVLVVYAAIFIVLGAVGAFGVPRLADQLTALAARGPDLSAGADQAAKDFQANLDRLGLGVNIVPLYEALPGRLAALAGAFASDALGVVQATATIVFDLFLVLIIAFLMLMDGDFLWNRFTGMLNEALRSEFELLRMSTDRSFGGFIRGSLLLGLLSGVAPLLILAAFGVPFSGVLAVFSGLVVMIPFFGPILALVPVLGITFLGSPGAFVPVAVLSILLQQVVLNVVSPRIMSNAIGIHPIFVFFALLLGSKIAGFWGVLLGVPIAGVINTFVRYTLEVNSGRRQRTQAAALMEDAPIEAAK
jgi:predicted PurR-regulated permease PerM